MPDPRLMWSIGTSSLFALFPVLCRTLASAFDGGSVVFVLPLALYYTLPASLFGDSWFSSGNFGPSPLGPGGHAMAAIVWGAVGAAVGYANGRWHYRRQQAKGGQINH